MAQREDHTQTACAQEAARGKPATRPGKLRENLKKPNKKKNNFPEISAWAINFAGVLENCFFGFFVFFWFLCFFGFFVFLVSLFVLVSLFLFGFFVFLVSLLPFAFMVFVVFFEMYLAVCCGRLQGLYSFCNS